MNFKNKYDFIVARGCSKPMLTMAQFISEIFEVSLEEAYCLVFECFYGKEGE